MQSGLSNPFSFLNELDKHERAKIFILAVAFFLVIGSYTLVKELKDFVFINIVGLDELPTAKGYSILVLIPMVFFYAKLVDILRRSDLLCFYALLYSIGGLVCTYYLGHPTIGLVNTIASPDRYFGWFFYFFMEGFSPFVVSVLWAFTNSVMAPENVKNSYVIMTASSKIGGAIMAGIAWWFLSSNACGIIWCPDIQMLQILLVSASLLLLCVPLVILYLSKKVSKQYLHGYEAAYQVEKQREEKGEVPKGLRGTIYSIFSGLYLLLKYPYVMGIFGMIFFWEIINVIFSYLRLCVGQSETKGVAEFGAFLYQQACLVHIVGFFFVFLGTRTLVAWLGERRSLIAVPVLIGGVIGVYLMFQSIKVVTVAFVLMRAINYALAYPLRESLYIPTTKAMKFKSKSWIDGFGSKLSKGIGSSYNYFMRNLVAASAIPTVNLIFFSIIIAMWTVMANALGRRFERAVEKNEVIGVEK
jgi:ATP:ADP antiporter, AAA family